MSSHVENRRIVQGIVASDKMDKSVTVLVETRYRHKRYKKFITRSSKYKAHDENNQCNVGDRVELIETRPLSKSKNWAVRRIVERAE